MSHRKPWFLKAKKVGDYSHLLRKDFNELRSTISKTIEMVASKHSHPNWKRIKNAALVALCELATKHGCTFRFNAEGGHVCIYKDRDPVFALRIGNYSRHRVEDLLKGKALYRGIIDIVPSVPLPIPNNLSLLERTVLLEMHRSLDQRMKVLYFLLPTRDAGVWKNKEAYDLVDVIECVKAHPGFSRSDIQDTLNFSPRKTIRLLDLVKRRRILHNRGSYKSSGWYLN